MLTARVGGGSAWVQFTGLCHVEAALAECGVSVGETKMHQALHWAYEAALEGSVQGRQRHSRQVCTFTAEHITMYAPAM